jgi:hypothetical protein
MRKLIFVFTICLLLLTLSLILFDKYQDNDKEEVTYSIKSSYAYLSNNNETIFDVRLYTSSKNSLIKYAASSNANIHDNSNDTIVDVEVIDVYQISNTTYSDENYYEYCLELKVMINELNINDAYLTFNFTNKAYTFYLGSIDIKENIYKDNELKIVDLYGVSSKDDISLAGIVLTINNESDQSIKITDISIGDDFDVILDTKYITEVKESVFVEDYLTFDINNDDHILIEANSRQTFILPIKYLNDYYLYNCYLIICGDDFTYLLSNYNYINSNDLEGLEDYLFKGMIYDI